MVYSHSWCESDVFGCILKRCFFTNLVFRQALVTCGVQQRAPSCLYTCRVECPSVTSCAGEDTRVQTPQNKRDTFIINCDKIIIIVHINVYRQHSGKATFMCVDCCLRDTARVAQSHTSSHPYIIVAYQKQQSDLIRTCLLQ